MPAVAKRKIIVAMSIMMMNIVTITRLVSLEAKEWILSFISLFFGHKHRIP